eukprot:scaffold2244_cov363-Pavlova_lutheri.AAC.17
MSRCQMIDQSCLLDHLIERFRNFEPFLVQGWLTTLNSFVDFDAREELRKWIMLEDSGTIQ